MTENNEADNLPEVDFQNTQTYLQYQKRQTKSSPSLIVGIIIFLLLIFIFFYPAFKNKSTSTAVQKPSEQSETIQPNHLTSQKTEPTINKNQNQMSKQSETIEDQSEKLPFKFNLPSDGDDQQKYKMLLGQLTKLTSADPQMSKLVQFLGSHNLNQLQQMQSLLPNEKGTNELINHLNLKNKFSENEEDSNEQDSQLKGTIKELGELGQDEDDSEEEENEQGDSEEEDKMNKMSQMESQTDQQQSEDDQEQQNIVHD